MDTSSVDVKIRCIKGSLGAYCESERTGDPWSEVERKIRINVLKLKAAKFAILAFAQNKKYLNSIHI